MTTATILAATNTTTATMTATDVADTYDPDFYDRDQSNNDGTYVHHRKNMDAIAAFYDRIYKDEADRGEEISEEEAWQNYLTFIEGRY